MNVSLHQLKVFVAVARTRSFTGAAREFGLTQSAVSRCIRELEESIDLRLFDRTTRQVALTSAGAAFERRIGRLLDEIELALTEGRALFNDQSGVVVLGSNPVLSAGWLPAGLAQCASAFPALTVEIRDLPQASIMSAVEQGEVDFAIVSDALPSGSSALETRLLFATPLCAVLPANHPLAQRDTLAWSDLDEARLVTLNADAGGHGAIARLVATRAPYAAPVQTLGHIAGVVRMVELGLGVGLLPVDPNWPAPPSMLAVRALQPAAVLSTMLVRRRNRSLRPNAEAVWAQLVAHASDASGAAGQGAARRALNDTSGAPGGTASLGVAPVRARVGEHGVTAGVSAAISMV